MKSRLLSILTALLLTSHLGAATINVTPQNFNGGNLPASASGDTYAFSPGTYTLTTNPTGAAANWPARFYVGGGAVLKLSGGIAPNDQQELVKFAPGSDVSGFTFTCAQIHCEGGAFNIHGNTFMNGRRGIFVAANSGHIDGNTFSQLNAEGVFGYNGSHGTYDHNSCDYVLEPFHLISDSDDTSISFNSMTHVTRIAIEVQNAQTNIRINNNFTGNWLRNPGPNDSHMSCSAALGGGKNITISGNVFNQDGPNQNDALWAKSAIEVMGSNVSVFSNACWLWQNLILNGSQLPDGCSTHDNTCYGVNAFQSGDAVAWTVPKINGTNQPGPGDKMLPLSPNPIPPGGPVTPPATQPTMTATATTTAITWSFPQASAAGNLVVKVKGNGASFGSFTVPIGATSVVTSGMQPNWEYVGTLTIGAAVQSISAQTLKNPGDATAGDGTPATPTAPPIPPGPTVTHTNILTTDGKVVWQQQVMSDGSVK